MFSRMPVPVWDSDMVFLEEPLDTATVVSDDIWKKFDLDVSLDNFHYRYQNDLLGQSSSGASSLPPHCETPMMMHFDKLNCQASRKIRHHDCMWAGLCISKEHNRTHPAKKDTQIHRRIPAGRSLLIPKANNQQHHQHQQQQQSQQQHNLQATNHHRQQSSLTANGVYQSSYRTTMAAVTNIPSMMMTTATTTTSSMTTTKNLESDGDSTRPETPQSSESETESEDDDDDEGPVFRHEQININDIVSMPVSEVTGQQIQRRPHSYDRRRDDDRMLRQSESQETAIRNTLMSDHCYHLNQQPMNSKKLEHLGVQTPSDSEEEIDVVSYEKPTRASSSTAASSLPTYPSPAEQQHFQLTVKTAFKEGGRRGASTATTTSTTTAPRPRGRPPMNSNRKRANQAAASLDVETTKPAKRAKQHRTYQRRATPQKNKSNTSSPQSSPSKLSAGNSSLASSSRSSSDDEPDTEKRSLHNNMERQRRIELRHAFEELRILVPEVEAKEKAPKVTILRQAAAFCDRLTDLEHLNVAKAAELRRKQDRLRAQLSQLRRSLALQR